MYLLNSYVNNGILRDNNDIQEKNMKKKEKGERNIRKLEDTIVEFIYAWSEVIDAKADEIDDSDETPREINVSKNRERVDSEPDSMFAYIYNWLEFNLDGTKKPHKPKRNSSMIRNRSNTNPIAADIVDYLCDNMPPTYNDEDTIKSSVYRALPKLVDEGKIQRCEATYIPVNKGYWGTVRGLDLANYATLVKRNPFFISSNTCIVFFNAKDLSNERIFFKRLLGDDLFDSIEYDGKLLLLLQGNKSTIKKVRIFLRNTIRDVYDIQQSGINLIETKNSNN